MITTFANMKSCLLFIKKKKKIEKQANTLGFQNVFMRNKLAKRILAVSELESV